MILKEIIKTNNWLSIELTLINLYPDQEDVVNDYKRVFEKLEFLEEENNDMLIVLTEYLEDYDEKTDTETTYVDVSGRKLKEKENSFCNSYALEFVKWEKWLGMELAPETLQIFNELEIIAHCLYEMTFISYEEEEIQEQFDAITDKMEEYKSLSNQEKKDKTLSKEELKEKLKNNTN